MTSRHLSQPFASSSNLPRIEEQELESIRQQENEEVDALVSMYEEPLNQPHSRRTLQAWPVEPPSSPMIQPVRESHCSSSSCFGSDDADYDAIFMELLEEKQHKDDVPPSSPPNMDVTMSDY